MNLPKLNLKFPTICAGFALAMTTMLASAYVLNPAKVPADEVTIMADKYSVTSRDCSAKSCLAVVQADDAQIFVEYQMDDASVEFLDIHQVTRKGEVINAYVDRYEISKINDALAFGLDKN